MNLNINELFLNNVTEISINKKSLTMLFIMLVNTISNFLSNLFLKFFQIFVYLKHYLFVHSKNMYIC